MKYLNLITIQVSVLALTLYVTYTDMTDLQPEGKLTLFAYDTVLKYIVFN